MSKNINNPEWICWNRMAQRYTKLGQKYYHTFPHEKQKEENNILYLRGKVVEPLFFQYTEPTNVDDATTKNIYCKKSRIANANYCGANDCAQVNKRLDLRVQNPQINPPDANNSFLVYKVRKGINTLIIFCTIVMFFLIMANIQMIQHVLYSHAGLSDSEFVSKVKFERKYYVALFYILSIMAVGVGVYITCAIFEVIRNRCGVFPKYTYKMGNTEYAKDRRDVEWDDGKIGKWVLGFMLLVLVFGVVAFYNILDHTAIPATDSQNTYIIIIAVLMSLTILMWVYYFIRRTFG